MTHQSTHDLSRLGELILLWLAPPSKKDRTRSELEKALAPLLGQRWSSAEQREKLDAEIAALEGSGWLQRVKKAALVLTDDGRRAALAVLGLKALPARANWGTVKKYLTARALGLPPPSSKAAQSFDKAEGLRAAILARHHRLAVGDYPTLSQVQDALAWRAMGVETDERFSRNAVLKRFLNQTLGATRPQEPERALEQLAAKAVSSVRADPEQLRTAALRRWLDETSGDGAAATNGAAAQENATAAPKPQVADDAPTFASRVLAAARASTTGRFGEDKVFISHVFRRLNEEGVAAGDLSSFKARLVAAHFGGLLRLGRADMVEAMDPKDVDTSETQYDGSTFHFVRI